jgi:phytanoyl-CoA dioxygenase PhyH
VIETLSRKLLHGRMSPAVYQARRLAHRSRRPTLSAADAALLAELETDGGCVSSLDDLDYAATAAMRSGVMPLLATLPGADAHVPTGDVLAGRSTTLHCFSIDPPELAARAPGVLLWGLDERMLDLVEAYLGVPPAFTTVHLRKDVGGGRQVGTRFWHIDTEDRRVIRVLVYLTDVTTDTGPFEYIPRPQTDACTALRDRALRSDGDPVFDDEMRRHVPESQWRACVGPAGTVVIADNAAVYHHGKVHDAERTVLIYTYTSRRPQYPRLERNPAFDAALSERQRACFFVPTD